MVAGFTRIGIKFCLAWVLIPVKPMALGFTLPKKKNSTMRVGLDDKQKNLVGTNKIWILTINCSPF